MGKVVTAVVDKFALAGVGKVMIVAVYTVVVDVMF